MIPSPLWCVVRTPAGVVKVCSLAYLLAYNQTGMNRPGFKSLALLHLSDREEDMVATCVLLGGKATLGVAA